MKVEDFEWYRNFDESVRKRVKELIKDYHNLESESEIFYIDYNLMSNNELFIRYNFDNQPYRNLLMKVEDFCDPDCIIGEVRKWH